MSSRIDSQRLPSAARPLISANFVVPNAAKPASTPDAFQANALLPSSLHLNGRSQPWVGKSMDLGTDPNGDNFQIALSGHYPPAAAGGFFEKLGQAEKTASNSLKAQESIDSHGSSPSDSAVQSQLDSLNVTPIDRGSPISQADYTSDIPGASPAQAYNEFVQNPAAVFGAGGLTVRPAASSLYDGQRLMLQSPGSPAVWFPIQVNLNPSSHEIDISTLDGHPFRGTNNFKFVDDGHGGTSVQQQSVFQGSSDLISTMGQSGLDKQHATWRGVQGYLYQQLNGGGGPKTTVSGTAAPQADIPDFGTTTSTIHIGQNVSIDQLAGNLDVLHNNPGNLKISLVSPAGTSAVIWDHEGGTTPDIHAPFDLSKAFAGESAEGDWTLVVEDQDNNGGDAGTLQDWNLNITGAARK